MAREIRLGVFVVLLACAIASFMAMAVAVGSYDEVRLSDVSVLLPFNSKVSHTLESFNGCFDWFALVLSLPAPAVSSSFVGNYYVGIVDVVGGRQPVQRGRGRVLMLDPPHVFTCPRSPLAVHRRGRGPSLGAIIVFRFQLCIFFLNPFMRSLPHLVGVVTKETGLFRRASSSRHREPVILTTLFFCL